MECVYLLQKIDFDETPTDLYKIGKTTKEAEQRKRQYQAWKVFREEQNAAWVIDEPCPTQVKKLDRK